MTLLLTPQITFYISVDIPLCRRENSLLFLLLMLGTLWLATTLYNFNQTPYLQVRSEIFFKGYGIVILRPTKEN